MFSANANVPKDLNTTMHLLTSHFWSIKHHNTIKFLIKLTMITKKDTMPYTRFAPDS